MCVPKCQHKIAQTLSRRNFLRGSSLVAAGAMAAGSATLFGAGKAIGAPPLQTTPTPELMPSFGFFSRVVDLTHTLGADFPTFGGDPQLTMNQVFALDSDGYNLFEYTLNEHTGTHMDAPFHFSDGPSADLIPVTDLIGPLVVVDIRAKAEEDPDAMLTPEDLAAWEEQYGEIPPGAIVAMNSGWDEFVATDKFRNADDDGVMHFPGFHVDAALFLLEERSVKGIFVDTLSLDNGPSATFDVHYTWLPANKWGMECVANLGQMPAFGATVIVGGPKIAGATGGPSRIIALV
ncbi:MAG: cyclase family protein [Anaerolineae bacterium]